MPTPEQIEHDFATRPEFAEMRENSHRVLSSMFPAAPPNPCSYPLPNAPAGYDSIAPRPKMRPELVVVCGLPRSGKTTYARTRNEPIVSPDAIRLALHGERFNELSEPFVWAI